MARARIHRQQAGARARLRDTRKVMRACERIRGQKSEIAEASVRGGSPLQCNMQHDDLSLSTFLAYIFRHASSEAEHYRDALLYRSPLAVKEYDTNR